MRAVSFFTLLAFFTLGTPFQDVPEAPYDDEAELARKWGFDVRTYNVAIHKICRV